MEKGYDGVQANLGTFLSSPSDHHQRCNLFSASSPGRNNQEGSNFWLNFEEILFDNPFNQNTCNFGMMISQMGRRGGGDGKDRQIQ